MKLAFDLISDLHVETWEEPFDFTGMPTSMLCVVCGDISRDRSVVVDTLRHLSECYKTVIYIDGNDEHRYSLDDLGESYKSLAEEIEDIPNVIFLQDNVVIVDGVAFLGTNGWWTYDMDPEIDYDQTRFWFEDHYQVNRHTADVIEATALRDFAYLEASVSRLQTYRDVKSIVIVTHTVPLLDLVEHDPELGNTYRINCIGNSHILKTLNADTERKIKTWCFGHYHGEVDVQMGDIQFVNNTRGRGNTPWCKSVYYPKRIVVDL